jgi:hypothetical protein
MNQDSLNLYQLIQVLALQGKAEEWFNLADQRKPI